MTDREYRRIYYMNNRDRILTAANARYRKMVKESDKTLIKPQKNWTEEEEEKLNTLKKLGFNAIEIAEKLNRTPNSVRSKLRFI